MLHIDQSRPRASNQNTTRVHCNDSIANNRTNVHGDRSGRYPQLLSTTYIQSILPCWPAQSPTARCQTSSPALCGTRRMMSNSGPDGAASFWSSHDEPPAPRATKFAMRWSRIGLYLHVDAVLAESACGPSCSGVCSRAYQVPTTPTSDGSALPKMYTSSCSRGKSRSHTKPR
jgi:hypothetical protein